ncbi:MAG: hypothetical protein V7603_5776 [Micromonosporaceae bacterium]|jgi:hypothetical protein
MNVCRLLSALSLTGVTLLGVAHGLAPATKPKPVVQQKPPPAPVKKKASPAELSPYAAALQKVAQTGLDRLAAVDGAGDPRYYKDGVWVHDGPVCLRCDVGPGVTASVLAAVTGNASDRSTAIQTMDTAIKLHRLSSGAFGPPAGAESGPDIQTTFFAVQLGLSLQALSPTLDLAHRTAWGQALAGAVDFLSKNGNFKWYTNGNIVLTNAVAAAMAWRATGDSRYKAIYDAAFDFALQPPQTRWPGRGLVTTTPASAVDPARAAGFLTEEGPGTPGFDSDYTQMQADMAAMLYLTTGESRALNLTSVLVNRMLPLVNQTTWELDTSGGSRHPAINRVVPFTTCALAVLASNGRPDLIPLAQSQSKAIGTVFAESVTYTNIGMYQYWGSRLAPTLLALG